MQLGLGLDIIRNKMLGSGIPLQTEYDTLLKKGQELGYSLPSAIQQICQNTLLYNLKKAGIWNKLDVFYVMATNGDSDFAALNWKDPNNHQITRVNSPTHIPNEGYKGNGVDAYLDTNFSASVNGVNYITADAGFGGHFTQFGSSLPYMSTDDFGAMIRNYGAPNNVRINTTQNNVLPIGLNNYNGLQGVYRVDSNTQRVIYGASNAHDNTATIADIVPSTTFKIFRLNTDYSEAISRVVFIGANLSDKHEDLNTIIEDYLSCISYETEYQAVIDKAVTSGYDVPSAKVQEAGNTLVKKVKENGDWVLIDTFHVPMTDGDSDFARLNWKDVDNYPLVDSGSGDGMLFETARGFKGQTNSYLQAKNYGIDPTIVGQADISHGVLVDYNGVTSNNTFTLSMNGYNLAIYTLAPDFAIRLHRTGELNVANPLAPAPHDPELQIQTVGVPNNTSGFFEVNGVSAYAENGTLTPENVALGFIRYNARGDGALAGGAIIHGMMWVGTGSVDRSNMHDLMREYYDTVAFETEYQTLINYSRAMGYLVPSRDVQIAQNDMVRELKEEGVWNKLEVLYCMLGDGDSNFAKLNLISPGTYTLYDDNGIPTYIVNEGFLQDTGKTKSPWYPALGSNTKFTLDNASLFILGGTKAAVTAPIGIQNNTYFTISGNRLGINGTFSSTEYVNAPGLFLLGTRPDNNTITLYKDGVEEFTEVDAATNLASFAASTQLGGSYTNLSDSSASLWGAGADLTEEQEELYTIINKYKNKVATINDDEYEAVITEALSQGYQVPSGKVQRLQSDLIRGLKEAGIWDKLDVLYITATDGDIDFAAINWKNPNNFKLNRFGSISFIPNVGYVGNGIDAYLSTTFTPSTDGVNYTDFDASRYIYTPETSAAAFLDGTSGTFNHISNANSSNQKINSPNSASVASNYNVAGLLSIHRTSNVDITMIQGLTVTQATQTSSLVSNEEQFILRSGSTYSSAKIGVYAMGASLVTENEEFNTLITNYINSL